ncbi:MAG TPA: hypothetical protein V6C65_14110, partial [Allocoleopsis sp.]
SHRQDRHLEISQVLQTLRTLRVGANTEQKPQRSGGRHRNLLAGCLLSLLLTNIGGYAWYRTSLSTQTSQQTSQKNQQLLADCNQMIQSQRSGKNAIDAAMISTAKKIEDSCSQIMAQAIDSNQSDLLKNRGKALLLLGKSSLALNQIEDAQKYLTEAKQAFQEALLVAQTDPQANFYLGFTKQLMKDLSFQHDFKTAINLYLNLEPAQIQPTDYPILVKLATYLAKQPGQPGYSAENFAKANQLYEKAKLNQQLPKPYLANLYYNQGVLNAKSNFLRAAKILDEANSINANNAYIKSYSNACLNPRGGNLAACDSPNAQFPTTLPVYACHEYPILAIAKLGSGNPDNRCQ